MLDSKSMHESPSTVQLLDDDHRAEFAISNRKDSGNGKYQTKKWGKK